MHVAADVQVVHASKPMSQKFWARYTRALRWVRWPASSACREVQFTAYGMQLEEAAVTLRQKRKLTWRQQRFIEEYLVDLSATQAAIRAGYSAHSAEYIGYQLLQKTPVSLAIQEAFQARSERTEISADWGLSRLRENVNRAMTAVPVFDKEGERTGEWTYQGNVANRALELLGKHLGLFPDKVEHAGGDGEPMKIRWVEIVRDPKVIDQDGNAVTGPALGE